MPAEDAAKQHLPPDDGGRKPVAPPPKPSDARRAAIKAWTVRIPDGMPDDGGVGYGTF